MVRMSPDLGGGRRVGDPASWFDDTIPTHDAPGPLLDDRPPPPAWGAALASPGLAALGDVAGGPGHWARARDGTAARAARERGARRPRPRLGRLHREPLHVPRRPGR